MFQHEERDISDNEDENENEDESDEEIGDVEKDEKDLVKITDLEPSLKKVEEAMNKVNILLQKQNFLLKCDICDFEAKKCKWTDKPQEGKA